MPKGIFMAVLQEPISVPPIFEHGSPHHITLFFDVEKEKYQHLIDTEFQTFSVVNCNDADIQALLCDIPSRFPHKPNPHITISHREGIAPNASNAMLTGDHQSEPLVIPLKLKIEFYEFKECEHHWVRNGRNHLGDQKYRCKVCGKVRTEGDRKVGRPKDRQNKA